MPANTLKRFKSVKVQLTLWYAFVLAVILSAFSVFMYTEFSRVLYVDVDKKMSEEALKIESSIHHYLSRHLNDRISETALQPGSEEYLRMLNDLSHWKRIVQIVDRSTMMIRLISADQINMAGNLKGWEKEIIFPDHERDSIFMESGYSFQTIHFQKKPIRLYYKRLRFKARPLVIIQLGVPIDEIENTLRRLVTIILISIPGAVLAACVAGWFLAKRSFRPVDHMIREARHITAAYLNARLPRTDTGDEVDRLAGTLNEMMDRIEASTKATREFSSDISHELKTPLAIIKGEIDLALRKPRSIESLNETLRTIAGEVDELIRLVHDLMLLLKSDAKQLRFEMKKTDLSEILAQIKDLFFERAQSKQVVLESDLAEGLYVKGDALYLKRLFSNLIDNAVKFSHKEGVVEIRLSREKKNKARIQIRDTGIGIEEQALAKIFDRFYRSDQARSLEGAGLGLSIAKAICEAHGGEIDITSTFSQGTVVQIVLPLFESL